MEALIVGGIAVAVFIVGGLVVCGVLWNMYATAERKRKMEKAMNYVFAEYPQFSETYYSLPSFARKLMLELGWKEITFSFKLDAIEPFRTRLIDTRAPGKDQDKVQTELGGSATPSKS